jgi:hypothetical protein
MLNRPEHETTHDDPLIPPSDQRLATPPLELPHDRDRDASRASGGKGATSIARDESRASAAMAADQAKQVASSATEGGKEVVQHAAEQTKEVAREATRQAQQLAGQVREQLAEQARQQTSRAAQNLHTVSEQARALAEGRVEAAGPMDDYVRRFADRVGEYADRLEQRGFEGTLSDVQGFARRRPALFIGLATAAGFVLTRIGRNLQGDGEEGPERPALPTHPMPTAVAAPVPPIVEEVGEIVLIEPAEAEAPMTDELDVDVDRGLGSTGTEGTA